MIEPPSSRSLISLDADRFDELMAGMDAEIELGIPGVPDPFKPRSLDDFHPDQLIKRLPTEPNRASATAESTPSKALSSDESTAETLARLLGRPGPVAKASGESAVGLSGGATSSFVRDVVGSVGVQAPNPEHKRHFEQTVSERVRALLHHPKFQALEASWRGLDFLVRRWSDESNIPLFLLNVDWDELAAAPDPLARLLRENPGSILVADKGFGGSLQDLELLNKIAMNCATTGSRLLAGASPQLFDCTSLATHPDPSDWTFPCPPDLRAQWESIRTGPNSSWIHLSTPRFLLRLPYGRSGERVEAIAFEEFPGVPEHEKLLWGTSSLLSVLGFHWQDEAESRGNCLEIGGLPVYCAVIDGTSHVVAPTETLLSERAAAMIRQRGVHPVRGIRGTDGVLVEGP